MFFLRSLFSSLSLPLPSPSLKTNQFCLTIKAMIVVKVWIWSRITSKEPLGSLDWFAAVFSSVCLLTVSTATLSLFQPLLVRAEQCAFCQSASPHSSTQSKTNPLFDGSVITNCNTCTAAVTAPIIVTSVSWTTHLVSKSPMLASLDPTSMLLFCGIDNFHLPFEKYYWLSP